MLKNRKTLGIIAALLASFAFGAYPPAARAVYSNGGNASFVVLMATIARMLATVGFCVLRKKPFLKTRSDIKFAIGSGFSQALCMISIFAALTYLPGPVVIIIIFTHTLMLLFFMAWRKEMMLDTTVILTTFIALIGLSFVLDIWHTKQSINMIGVIFAFVGAVTTVNRLYVFGRESKTRDPVILAAETFIFTLLFVGIAVLFVHPQLPVNSIGYVWVTVAALSQALATFGMFYGIALLGSFQFSLLAKTEPIFTAIFSLLFIHEILNPTQYFGITVVITSLVTYQYFSSRNKKLTQ